MASLVSLQGIDIAIAGLALNPETLQARLLTIIRSYFSSEESLEDTNAIPIEEIIKKLWETEAPEEIKQRRKSVSSLKSALNKRLKQLTDTGGNEEGIVISRDNIFVVSDEKKNSILEKMNISAGTEQSLLDRLASFQKLFPDLSQGPGGDIFSQLFSELEQSRTKIEELQGRADEATKKALEIEKQLQIREETARQAGYAAGLLEGKEIAEGLLPGTPENAEPGEEKRAKEIENIFAEGTGEASVDSLKGITPEELGEFSTEIDDGIAAEELEEIEVEDIQEVAADELEGLASESGEGSDAEDLEEIDADDIQEVAVDELGGLTSESGEGSDAEDLEDIDADDIQEVAVDELEGLASESGEGSDAEDLEEIEADDILEVAVDELGGLTAESGEGSDAEDLEEIDADDILEVAADELGGLTSENGEGSDAEDLEEIEADDILEVAADELGGLTAESGEGSDAEDLEEIDAHDIQEVAADELGGLTSENGEGSDAEDLEEIDADDIQEVAADELGGLTSESGEGSDAEDLEEIDADDILEVAADELGGLTSENGEGNDAEDLEEIDADDILEVAADELGGLTSESGEGSDAEEFEEIDADDILEVAADELGGLTSESGEGSDAEEFEEIDEDDIEEIQEMPETAEVSPARPLDLSDYIEADQALAEESDHLIETGEEYIAKILERFTPKFVRIPAGRYLIGSRNPTPMEQPAREVALSSFYIGQVPVTNELFELFVRETGYETEAEKAGYGMVYTGKFLHELDRISGRATFTISPGKTTRQVAGANWRHPAGPGSSLDNKQIHPVVQVSRRDALAFAAWAGKRLPTEEEWEAGARGRDDRLFPWGSIWNAGLGNFETSHLSDTTPVKQYGRESVSPFGLYDLLGNVSEWTASTYQKISSILPGGGVRQQNYILKGGFWGASGVITIAHRRVEEEKYWSNTIGFRCAV